MKNVTGIIILLVFVFISMMGCQDVTVGYLMTSNATYTPDSMVVKAVLDPVEDERQIKFEIPWQSAQISVGNHTPGPLHGYAWCTSAHSVRYGLVSGTNNDFPHHQ